MMVDYIVPESLNPRESSYFMIAKCTIDWVLFHKSLFICLLLACPCTMTQAKICGLGKYMDTSTRLCSTTPSGYYSSLSDGILVPCRFSSLDGAAICIEGGLGCKAGQYFNGSTCMLVPLGFYNPFDKAGMYYLCDGNEHLGAASCDPRGRVDEESSCSAGFTFNGFNCAPVPKGMWLSFSDQLFYFHL